MSFPPSNALLVHVHCFSVTHTSEKLLSCRNVGMEIIPCTCHTRRSHTRKSAMRYQNKRRPTPKGTLATVLGLLGLLSTVNHAVGADSFICTIDDRTLHLELVG